MNSNKKTSLYVGIAIGAILLIGYLTYTMIKISSKNKEVGLRTLVEGQQDVCKGNFDKMFKSIQQVAKVTEEAKNTFKEIYPEIIKGRYENDNGLIMKWVQESNPTFDFKLYDKLMDVIIDSRNEFFQEQKKLVSYAKQHKAFIGKWPNTMFFEPTDTVAYKIITSTNTEKVYQTGKEDDLEMFKR